MATMRSGEIMAKLEPLGWIVKPLMGFVCGDPSVIDPISGKEYSLYEAEKIQEVRDQVENWMNGNSHAGMCLDPRIIDQVTQG